MALSNLDKDNLYRLFNMINIENNNNEKMISNIKSNNTTYAKLQVITKQIEMLSLLTPSYYKMIKSSL